MLALAPQVAPMQPTHHITRKKWAKLRKKKGTKQKDWSHIVSWEFYNKAIAPKILGEPWNPTEEESIAQFLQTNTNGRIKHATRTQYSNRGKSKQSDRKLDQELIKAINAQDKRELSIHASLRAARIWKKLSSGGGVLPDKLLAVCRELMSSLKSHIGQRIVRTNAKVTNEQEKRHVLQPLKHYKGGQFFPGGMRTPKGGGYYYSIV